MDKQDKNRNVFKLRLLNKNIAKLSTAQAKYGPKYQSKTDTG